MTQDCKRNGTTTLFAAMSMLDGAIISRYAARHCETVCFAVFPSWSRPVRTTLARTTPQPFGWTANVHDILAKVMRANRKVSSKQNEARHKARPSAILNRQRDSTRVVKETIWCCRLSGVRVIRNRWPSDYCVLTPAMKNVLSHVRLLLIITTTPEMNSFAFETAATPSIRKSSKTSEPVPARQVGLLATNV